MRILSIETSCDETSAAIVTNNSRSEVIVLSNVTATSSTLHATTGGIIPEFAAREQAKAIIPVITEALLLSRSISPTNIKTNYEKANKILKEDIDAIAVTYGPGLIGSLIVGVETAKTLSYAFGKPIIPVNHLLAHLYANFISSDVKPEKIEFPFVGLIVSGGHTDLLYFESHEKYQWLGGTRDDAAGEALDKIGRLLNLAYPAGPEIEKRAKKIKSPDIKFQSPMINSKDFDFSFSGLKAESARFIEKNKITEHLRNHICYAVQEAIIQVLIKKTIKAALKYNAKYILLGGGVSANQTLKNALVKELKKQKLPINISTPKPIYATDNAAMIGAYAAINPTAIEWKKIRSNPELYFA